MSLLSIKNLTVEYDGASKPVFENLNLELDTSWNLGITARNGKGKTTLFKVLCQELSASGQISCPEAFARFPKDIGNDQDNSLQAVCNAYKIEECWKVRRELGIMGLSDDLLELPYGALSEGEKICFQMAALFSLDGFCLLLDEPTNHLDTEKRRIITDYLKTKQGFFLASHDRALLDAVCDHILAFNKDSIELVQGGFSAWQAQKEDRIRSQKESNERIRKEISRLSASSKEKSGWSAAVEKSKNGGKAASGLKKDRGFISHKAAKMARRAKSLEKRVEEKTRQRKAMLTDVEETEALKIQTLPFYTDRFIWVLDAAIWYGNPGSKQPPVFKPVSFTVTAKERLSLTGLNGSGKSTLLHQIVEAIRQHAPDENPDLPDFPDQHLQGIIQPASRLKISWIPQTTEEVSGTLDDFAFRKGADPVLFRALLRKLGFSREQFALPLQEASDGQKRKIQLAASLCAPANLYIWDEPLNYLDLDSRIQVENLILECQPSLLFVEHDPVFQKRIATGTITLEKPDFL